MRILFVGFPYSVHVARWIAHILDLGHEIHLFPSQEFDDVNAELRDITYWPATTDKFDCPPDRNIEVRRTSSAYDARRKGAEHAQYLAAVMAEIPFDIVHSLEFQHAGYLTFAAIERAAERPKWIATNYGSDIFLYAGQEKHRLRIVQLLQSCDYYSAECRRDLALARDLGFTGQVFTVLPNNGGMSVEEITRADGAPPPSRRKVVTLKGYQHFAGRALTALTAFELCRDVMGGYEIVIFSPFPQVRAAAETLAQTTGLFITCLPESVPHGEILALHARSRVSVANSISDGISTSLIEAMAMGSFPLQSRTACASEWLVHGEGGYITDPEDAGDIAQGLRLALSDDDLVDRAAVLNRRRVLARADREVIRREVLAAYEEVIGG